MLAFRAPEPHEDGFAVYAAVDIAEAIETLLKTECTSSSGTRIRLYADPANGARRDYFRNYIATLGDDFQAEMQAEREARSAYLAEHPGRGFACIDYIDHVAELILSGGSLRPDDGGGFSILGGCDSEGAHGLLVAASPGPDREEAVSIIHAIAELLSAAGVCEVREAA